MICIECNLSTKSEVFKTCDRCWRKLQQKELCKHVVGIGLTFDTYLASYPCGKCGEYFQKSEEIDNFKKRAK